MYVFICIQDVNVPFLLFVLLFPLRPKSTPTPTASFSVNGMPMEAVDYERLKQVVLICHHSHICANLRCQRSCHITTPDG